MKYVWIAAITCVAACSSSPGTKLECTLSADCSDPAKPYCVEGVCHACNGSSACTPDLPVCAADMQSCGTCAGDGDCSIYPSLGHCASDGACVGCVDNSQCAGATPHCSPETNACVGCVADTDCASELCDDASGQCVDAATIIYATPDGSTAGSCGAITAPCTITEAFAVLDATRNTIKLAPGAYAAGPLTLTTGVVSVYGEGATLSTSTPVAALHVNAGTRLTVVGLTIHAPSTAIECLGTSTVPGEVHVERVTGIASTVLALDRCNATVRRSVLQGVVSIADSSHFTDSSITRSRFEREPGGTSDAGGLSVSLGAQVHVSNCTFEGMDYGFVDGGGSPAAGGDISFSTFVNTVVICGTGATPTFALSNNIIYSSVDNQPVVLGTACTNDHEMVSSLMNPPNPTNILHMNPMLVDLAGGDFHLTAGSPAIDAADPGAALNEDLEGTSRPQGARSDLGAFEYKP